LEDANLMLGQYNRPDPAAALLYESAKQSINANANLNGQNPGAIGAKKAYLRNLTSRTPGNQSDLMQGWEAVTRLHIHADRGHLTETLFRDAWQTSQSFIDDMLTIYHANR